MNLIAIAWMYVVLMMAVAEALSAQGTLLGAFFTLLLYGLLPLSVVLYIVGAPGRGKLRRRAEAAARQAAAASAVPVSAAPDGGSPAAGDAVAPERKES